MAKVFYSETLKHEVYDLDGSKTKSELLRAADDYQEVTLSSGDKQLVKDGVLTKQTQSDIEAKEATSKLGKKNRKQLIFNKLGLKQEDLQGLRELINDGDLS